MSTEDNKEFDVAIVGGGVAGSAAALRAAQYHLATAWITGDAETRRASRAEYVYNVDNMIGWHPGPMVRKVLALLEGDEHTAARERIAVAHFHIGTKDVIENVRERIERDYAGQVLRFDETAVAAARDGDGFRVRTAGGREVRARALVLATGVMDAQPSVKLTTKSGKVRDEVVWIFPYANYETVLYCVRCEGHLTREVPSAVIGHAEPAAQIALMLHERYDTPVTLLTNGAEPSFAADTARLLDAYGLAVRRARITAIRDGGARPRGSSLVGFGLEDGTEVEARFALVALGLHRVYNDLARALGAELEDGDEDDARKHVLVDDATAETDVPGLFCIGDMACRRDGGPLMKQVYTAQEYAVRALDEIDRRRRKERRRSTLERR